MIDSGAKISIIQEWRVRARISLALPSLPTIPPPTECRHNDFIFIQIYIYIYGSSNKVPGIFKCVHRLIKFRTCSASQGALISYLPNGRQYFPDSSSCARTPPPGHVPPVPLTTVSSPYFPYFSYRTPPGPPHPPTTSEKCYRPRNTGCRPRSVRIRHVTTINESYVTSVKNAGGYERR